MKKENNRFAFNWDMLTENEYKKCIKKYNKDPWSVVDQYIGNISVGELHFNVLFRNYSDNDEPKIALSYDCYVANEDTGYGYTLNEDGSNNIPYDYADGTDYNILTLAYKDFVVESEKLISDFIIKNDRVKVSYSLTDKAMKPLFVW